MAPAAVDVLVDNSSADVELLVTVEGALVAPDATCAGGGATTYTQTLTCLGTGLSACGRLEGLRPGAWVNRLTVTVRDSAPQVQATAAVFLADPAGNVVTWTIYPRAFVVSEATEVDLRAQLDAAAQYTAAHPGDRALVTFARAAFPGTAAPRTIEIGRPVATPLEACRNVALCLSGSRFVIDALDADARAGGVVLLAGADDDADPPTRGLALLRVVGGDNVLRGLELHGGALDTPCRVDGVSRQWDTLAMSGAGARNNRVERCVVVGPSCGDATSADTDATGNVIEQCEVRNARDRGLKVTTGAQVELRQSCVHDNRNGGVQSTMGGHVVARDNLIQRNVPGPSGNGLSVTGRTADRSFMETRGNIVRFAGGRGISVTDNSEASFSNDYVADNQFAGSKVETTERGPVGTTPRARFRGTAFVCNRNAGISGVCEPDPGDEGTPCKTAADCCEGDDGSGTACDAVPPTCAPLDNSEGIGASQAQATGRPGPEVDFGTATDPGRNAFTWNRNPRLSTGANLKHRVAGALLPAHGNQWEHCGIGNSCLTANVQAQDVVLGPGAGVDLGSPSGPRAGALVLTTVTPSRPAKGAVVRVFGDNFNAIEGTGCAGATEPVAPCSVENPGRTSANRIELLNADRGVLATLSPDAVTPTMVAFRMPFDCFAPLQLRVSKTDPAGRTVSREIPLCDPAVCADQPASTRCDDGNPCTVDDHCSGGEPSVCTGDAFDCGGQCLGCDPTRGCIAKPSTAACDDGDACTVGDRCSGTADTCVAGTGTLSCVATCLTGACDPQRGCVPKAAAEPCVDNNACTVGDHCSGEGNVCLAGPARDCSGQCLTGACNTFTGCVPRPSSALCEEGNACTVNDHCSGTSDVCIAGAARRCNGTCDLGVCDQVAGCLPKAVGEPCEDTNLCTLGDQCGEGGMCISGAEVRRCDGGCLTGVCEPQRGCVATPADTPCDDGSLCTVDDRCSGGTCRGRSVECRGACLTGDCDPQQGCVPQAASGRCGDNSVCTIGDHCSGDGNVCVPGPARSCDGPCLTGVCHPLLGCLPKTAEATCDDGNECTVGDRCSGTGNACVPGTAVLCAGPCETGACDPQTGCVFAPAGSACEDGNRCTVGDRCQADGTCVTGTDTPACDGPCLTGACMPAQGCVPRPATTPCDDGNACTTADHCSGETDGTCTGGASLACDGSCLTGVCDPATGCVVKPEGDKCTPADPCRDGTCDHAVCVGVADKTCDDGDCLTIDRCEAGVGCRNEPSTGIGRTDCCLGKVSRECSDRKIAKRIAKQWRKADQAVAAVQTPKPDRGSKRQKRLDRAINRLKAFLRQCPDGAPLPECLKAQGVS